MDTFSMRRSLLPATIILAALNVVLLAIIGFSNPDCPPIQAPRGGSGEEERLTRLLKEELGFDQAQVETYLASRALHREQVRVIKDDIQRIKQQMFDGVLNDGSAAVLSDSLLRLTIDMQTTIEHLTFEHFLALKKICRPEQQARLHVLIHELFKTRPADRRDARESRGKDAPPEIDRSTMRHPRGEDRQEMREAQPDRRDVDRRPPPRDDPDRPRPPRDDRDRRRPPRDDRHPRDQQPR